MVRSNNERIDIEPPLSDQEKDAVDEVKHEQGFSRRAQAYSYIITTHPEVQE